MFFQGYRSNALKYVLYVNINWKADRLYVWYQLVFKSINTNTSKACIIVITVIIIHYE